ncbi:bacterial regulatory s, gntR family protein [Desulfovibrio sp. A2]|nr:bacterial regulatory s, gntR family protein [Desulfovibrio sp. A2]
MFILNHADSAPLYVQLYTQIRDRVLTGGLPAGTRLPSVRHLADELGVSRNTVDAAYLELIAEGFLLTRPRSGFFIAPAERHRVFGPHAPGGAAVPVGTADAMSLAGETGVRNDAAQPPCRYDFHPARLDGECFPLPLWRAYYLECLREAHRDLAQYADPQGEPELRQAIGDYLQRSRGVACTPDSIVVCAGLQHSLGVVADLVAAPARRATSAPMPDGAATPTAGRSASPAVGVEDPGYPLPRALFRNRGFRVTPVPVGPDGMDVDALSQSRCTLAYVTPSHQFPLGHVMPVRNRLRLIQWAAGGGNVIIEDDYDSELRYAGTPVPSMQGLRPEAAIVYTGTFSKILSPALRLSYMVLPPGLLEVYRQRFRHHHAMVPLLEQRVLARFMARGHWDRHVRRVRTVYRQRHDALLRAIDRRFGTRATVVGQGAGLHVVVRLHGTDASERELAARGGQKGIHLLPFSDTRMAAPDDGPMLLLGFGGMAAAELEPAVELLHQACFPAAP